MTARQIDPYWLENTPPGTCPACGRSTDDDRHDACHRVLADLDGAA